MCVCVCMRVRVCVHACVRACVCVCVCGVCVCRKASYLTMIRSNNAWLLVYVTGYWKTDHNVTLGQLHFIGPANSHTHALSMHCCITGLSRLVCFSRAGFADHVKSRLRQWDPWRALDGRCGSDIHPCVGETSLKALQSCQGL